jgi:hypothetical protein
MAHPNYIKKTWGMKPEVSKIFDDLEAWLDHCRFNLLPFNPADLYKSEAFKTWQKDKERTHKKYKKETKYRQQQ